VKEHALLANKVCVNCKSKRTSMQWLKSKILEGADLCNNCYQKEVYQLSKFTANGAMTSVEELVKPLMKRAIPTEIEEKEKEEDEDEDEDE
jgi:hypothetical protein|tara:strand:+ start:485 stop:757 length:273 start_codon:yes stop_codon:yes gene_type:complete